MSDLRTIWVATSEDGWPLAAFATRELAAEHGGPEELAFFRGCPPQRFRIFERTATVTKWGVFNVMGGPVRGESYVLPEYLDIPHELAVHVSESHWYGGRGGLFVRVKGLDRGEVARVFRERIKEARRLVAEDKRFVTLERARELHRERGHFPDREAPFIETSLATLARKPKN